MRSGDKGRIAIFQARRHVDCQSANCVIAFAKAGYNVEFFIFNNWNTWTYVELEKLNKCKRVQIHDLSSADRPACSRVDIKKGFAFRQRLKTFLRATFPFINFLESHMLSVTDLIRRNSRTVDRLLRGSDDELLSQRIVSQSLDIMCGKNYRCLIGVEKGGLIWAGQIAERLHLPFVYYSLELYTKDYERLVMGSSIDFKRLRSAERRYHRRAYATIIQDPDRARVLFQDNGISMSDAIIYYVPVSLIGGPYKKRSWFLHETLGIPKDRKVILYFGQIWERRHVFELAQVAQTFPEDWVLVMHGPEYYSAAEKIEGLNVQKRVIISLKMVPSDQLRVLVESADIGLAFYSDLIQNDQLTAFASEKMALYMQCGVPFIAFDYPGYRRLVNEDRCGMVIRSLQELADAIHKILASQEEFRQHAYEAFCKHYDFKNNFAKVIEAISRL